MKGRQGWNSCCWECVVTISSTVNKGVKIACWYTARLMIERLQVRSLAGALEVGEFSSPELTFFADSYLVSVPPSCHHSGMN